MKTTFRLALVALLAVGLAGACRSPTDTPPYPEDEDRDPGSDSDSEAFIAFERAPILV